MCATMRFAPYSGTPFGASAGSEVRGAVVAVGWSRSRGRDQFVSSVATLPWNSPAASSGRQPMRA